MITTTLFNPEIESIIKVNKLTKGKKQKSNEYRLRISRCSIHSAYVVKVLQGVPFVVGFSCGIGGKFIKNFLDKNRIKSSLVNKDNEVRTKFLIVDDEVTTTIIDDNMSFKNSDFRNIKHIFNGNMDKSGVFIVSGEINSPEEVHLLENTVEFIHSRNKRYVLSLDDSQYDRFFANAPTAVIGKFSQFSNVCKVEDDLYTCLIKLKELAELHKIRYIIIYDENIIYGISKNKIVSADVSPVKDVNRHAVAGALALGIKRKYEFEKIVKLLSAVAATFEEDKFPNSITRNKIDKMKSKILLKEIYSLGSDV